MKTIIQNTNRMQETLGVLSNALSCCSLRSLRALRLILVAVVLTLTLTGPVWAQSSPEENLVRKGGATTTTAPAGSGNFLDGLPRMVVSLAVVVGLIYLARFLLRKAGRSGKLKSATGPVEIIWRSNLTLKQQLILARMGRRLLLIGAGPGGLTTLSELSDPEEITDLLASIEQGKADSFTNMLASKAGQYVQPGATKQGPPHRDDGGAAGEAARRLAEKLRAMDKGGNQK